MGFMKLAWVHAIIIWKVIFDPAESVAFSIHFESLSPFVLDYLGYHLAVTVSLMNADVAIRDGYYTIKMFQ